MRNLNQGPRLAGSTLSEIKRAYEVARVRIGSRTKASGASKPGEFLSSVLIHFLDLPEAEQFAAVEHGMRRLAGLKEGEDDEGDWRRPQRETPAGGAGGPSGVRQEANSGAKPPAARRRGKAGA